MSEGGRERILLLNQLTGRVHDYKGTAIGGLGSEEHNSPVGIIPCGCDGFDEACEADELTVINPRHLERGIWEPAKCLDADIPPLEERARLMRDYCQSIAENPHDRSGCIGSRNEEFAREMATAAQMLDTVLWEPDGDTEFIDPAENWQEIAEQIDEWDNED